MCSCACVRVHVQALEEAQRAAQAAEASLRDRHAAELAALSQRAASDVSASEGALRDRHAAELRAERERHDAEVQVCVCVCVCVCTSWQHAKGITVAWSSSHVCMCARVYLCV